MSRPAPRELLSVGVSCFYGGWARKLSSKNDEGDVGESCTDELCNHGSNISEAVDLTHAGLYDNSWDRICGRTLNVRCGPDYSKNKKKKPSLQSLYTLIGMDVLSSPRRIPHIGRFFKLPAHVKNCPCGRKSSTSEESKGHRFAPHLHDWDAVLSGKHKPVFDDSESAPTRTDAPIPSQTREFSNFSSSETRTPETSRSKTPTPRSPRSAMSIETRHREYRFAETSEGLLSPRQERVSGNEDDLGGSLRRISSLELGSTNLEVKRSSDSGVFSDEVPKSSGLSGPTDSLDTLIPPYLIVNIMLPSYAPANPIWGSRRRDGEGYCLVLHYVRSRFLCKVCKAAAEQAQQHKNNPTVKNESTENNGESNGKSKSSLGRIFSFFSSNKDNKSEEDKSTDDDCVPPSVRLWQRFVHAAPGDNDRHRLKCIVRLNNIKEANFSGTVRRLALRYNAKPFMIKTTSSFYKTADYFEIDVNCHDFSYPARYALNGVIGRLPKMQYDIAFTVQGDTNRELPEQIFAAVRLNRVDPRTSPPIPEWVLDEIEKENGEWDKK